MLSNNANYFETYPELIFDFSLEQKIAEVEGWDNATHMKYGSRKEYYLLHINILYAISQKAGYYTDLLSEHCSSHILGQITCGVGEKHPFHCFILPFPEQKRGNSFF